MAKRKELSAALDRWMNKNGKTAEDVASLAHVSVRTVERFLNGETTPTRLFLEAIERLLSDSKAVGA